MLNKAKENPLVVYDDLSEKEIKFAPLQFSDQVQNYRSDDMGHLHRRSEKAERLRRCPTENISHDSFFDRAQEQAEKTKKNGNIVGVLGQPGVGKTTFTEKLLEDYANKREIYQSKLVFYLKFRYVNYSDKLNLLEFLAPTFVKNYTMGKKRRNALLNKLNNSVETLIIMDGLDEADINISDENCPEINILSKQTAEVFIKNILRGTILSKAKKLITSRPRQLTSLPKDFRPRFCINIIGLDINAQKQICRDVCVNKPDETFGYVQDHSELSAYCHVPFNCILVMLSVNSLKTKKSGTCDNFLPCTLTGILSFVLIKFINSGHYRGRFVCDRIANLAWNGFKQKKNNFNESDISEANLTKDDLKDMFVTFPNKIRFYFCHSTYFCHLVMQEFFVALKLIFFMQTEELKKVVSKSFLNKDRFEMVAKFIFGLCNKETFKNLKEMPQFVFPEQQTIVLKTILKTKIIRIIRSGKINDRLIRYFCLLYEMHDTEFTQEIASQLPDRVELNCKMLPTDFEPLHYVLRLKETPTSILNVDSKDHFHGDCWKRFLENDNWKNTSIEVSY